MKQTYFKSSDLLLIIFHFVLQILPDSCALFENEHAAQAFISLCVGGHLADFLVRQLGVGYVAFKAFNLHVSQLEFLRSLNHLLLQLAKRLS